MERNETKKMDDVDGNGKRTNATSTRATLTDEGTKGKERSKESE